MALSNSTIIPLFVPTPPGPGSSKEEVLTWMFSVSSFLGELSRMFEEVIDVATTDASQITDGSVTSAKILDETIATSDLSDTLVTTVKVADSAITSVKLGPLSVTTAKVAASAITATELQASGITEVALGPSSVTTTKVQNYTLRAADSNLNADINTTTASATIIGRLPIYNTAGTITGYLDVKQA